MFDLTAALFPDSVPLHSRPGPCAPLQQSALYARAARLLGAQVRYLALPGTGAWVVHRRLPLVGDTGLISRGPATLLPGSARALRRASGARHLIVNAEDDCAAEALALAGFWRIARPRVIAELQLAGTAEAMAAGLSPKWRNRLRHAMRQGLQLRREPFGPNPRHWIFEAEARAARHLGYQPMPPAMVAALAAACPGAAQLFVARAEDGPVAAMLFLRHGRVATYQIGWSTPAGRAASAGNLLMWRAMLDLQAMGIDRIDLGAADPAQAAGLAHFKRGTGARLRALGGTWMSSAALPRRRALGRSALARSRPGTRAQSQTTAQEPAAARAS